MISPSIGTVRRSIGGRVHLARYPSMMGDFRQPRYSGRVAARATQNSGGPRGWRGGIVFGPGLCYFASRSARAIGGVHLARYPGILGVFRPPRYSGRAAAKDTQNPGGPGAGAGVLYLAMIYDISLRDRRGEQSDRGPCLRGQIPQSVWGASDRLGF